MTAPRYRALSPYLTERFGCKVYKLSLDGGMTCPNRDGTLGTRGCIFCSGAGEFAAPVCGSVTQQLEAAKAQIRRKAPHARYIAYFQSFTNTYASVGRLEALFSEALAHPETVRCRSPRGRTVWGTMCSGCWRGCGAASLCGLSWACKPSIREPPPIFAGDMTCRFMTGPCARCMQSASRSSHI